MEVGSGGGIQRDSSQLEMYAKKPGTERDGFFTFTYHYILQSVRGDQVSRNVIVDRHAKGTFPSDRPSLPLCARLQIHVRNPKEGK